MPTYPMPIDNPRCHCAGAWAAMMCMTGHMLECHHPMDCREAGCGHLGRYDVDPETVELHQTMAAVRLAEGQIAGYRLDPDHPGHVIAEVLL